MNILENISLKKFNTFNIDVNSKYFLDINKVDDLNELYSDSDFKNIKKLFLGGGSNILFTKDFDGIILKNNLKGIEVAFQDANFIYLKSYSGELWNDFVSYCVNNNLGGVENLSLIPGTVGATAIQNVGAYGVSVSDVVFEIEAFDFDDGIVKKFSFKDCEFGYRDSVFKNKFKDKFFIISIIYKLNKNPVLNIDYKDVKFEIEKNNIQDLNVKIISDIICKIRTSKMPDFTIIGNAGSFFKNPIVSKDLLEEIKNDFNNVVFYEFNDSSVKISAAWLIENAGLKGKRVGDCGVYDKHALVIVNYGGASGFDVLSFSDYVISEVYKKFKIKLEKEVNVI